jgi:hypothetical protein
MMEVAMMGTLNRYLPTALMTLCLLATTPALTLADSIIVSGECGILDTELTDASPHFVDTTVLVNTCDYVPDYMSPGAYEIWTDGNAGGSSIYSEIFAYEIASQCEDALLLKTETEILYIDPHGKLTDLLLEIDGLKIGVSVTRAFIYPLGTPLTPQRAEELLTDKLEGVLLSSANVAPADQWVKQILVVETPTVADKAVLTNAYAGLDPAVKADTICWVVATDGDDGFIYTGPDPVCDPSAVPEPVGVATLGDAYPNPFNPHTTIAFDIPRPEVVSLRVFDLSGSLVRNLLVAESRTSGRHELVWNGRDDAGREVASGAYFYRLEAGDFSETKRMVLIK